MKLGFAWTAYLILSFVIFLVTGNTMQAAIAYGFLIGPFYLVIWVLGLENIRVRISPHKKPKLNYPIWLVVIALQASVILTAPSLCQRINEVDNCYSNLQIIISNLPESGALDISPWAIANNAFIGLLSAYATALIVAKYSTRFKSIKKDSPSES